MNSFLLDSNHLGSLIHPNSTVFKRFHAMRLGGARFGTIVPVLCEVDAGLATLARRERCLQLMRRAASCVKVCPLEPPLARVFGDVNTLSSPPTAISKPSGT